MDLRRMECFVAVAELLSFREAAKRLHLSPSPLTRQIMALEQEVGTRLLDRDRGRAVTLTEAGRAFLKHAQPALQGMRTAVRQARMVAQGQDGRLAIVGCGMLGAPMVAAHLKAFRQAAPEVEVSFTVASYTERQAALEEGRAHVAISPDFGVSLPPIFQHQVLAPIDLVTVLPGDHALARQRGTLLAWETLNGETLLCPTDATVPGYPQFFRGVQHRTGLTPGASRTVDGVQNILHMVVAGFGVSVLPKLLVGTPPSGCRVKRLRLPAPGFRLRMIWRRDAASPALRQFLEMLDRPQALRLGPT